MNELIKTIWFKTYHFLIIIQNHKSAPIFYSKLNKLYNFIKAMVTPLAFND